MHWYVLLPTFDWLSMTHTYWIQPPQPHLGIHIAIVICPKSKFQRMVQLPPYLTVLTCSLCVLQAT